MLNTKLYLCKKARLIEVLDIISRAIAYIQIFLL